MHATIDLPPRGSAPASLARFVETVRIVAPAAGRAQRVDRLPDGRTALIFRIGEHGRGGDVGVAGPRTRALLKDASGFKKAMTLVFKPGWSTPLLGVAANELTDDIVMLDSIWGRSARDLAAELVASKSVAEVLDRLARALTARLERRDEPASAPLARRAVRLMEEEQLRVETVAERLGVTPRHLRRVFVENIGVGPKDFARSVRLQRAVRLAATTPILPGAPRPTTEWARIASDAGYYDQSHLIAEFRDLVGMTPSAYLRRAAEGA